jgi:hypothetical protein
MHYYLYDTFLGDKKYEKVIDRIKTRLLDLEIQGKHEKLSLLKSIDELISDEVKRGANSIIVVGNEKIFLKVVDAAAKNNVSLGMIPVGENNHLAECLGLPMEEAACDVIAARKIVSFDLGKVNNQYFFSNLKITKNLDRLSIQKDNYKIVPRADCESVEVVNFYLPPIAGDFERKMKKCTAQDQLLELVIRRKGQKRRWFGGGGGKPQIDSLIQGNEFEIKSFEYLPALMDDYRVIKTPIKVEVEHAKLKVIVGKNRLKTIK